MLKASFKYTILLTLILSHIALAQIPKKKIDVDIFPYLSILLSRAKSDVSKVISDSKLNERIAITRFESVGLEIEDKYRTLIIKSFEEIRKQNKFFHMVGSIEALNKTIIVDTNLELYNPKQLSEMKHYSLELNADYYGIINVAVVGKSLVLSLIIRSAQEHSIIWGKKWSTILREGNTSFNIGFYQGITFAGRFFSENMFPFYLHLGLDWKIFTFVDFGFYLDPGVNILYPPNRPSNIFGFGISAGLKLSIDLVNIFNVLYKNIEFPIYVRGGLTAAYNLEHIFPTSKSALLMNVTAKPGAAIIINRNYVVFFEFDLQGVGTQEFAVFAGFYYRFEF